MKIGFPFFFWMEVCVSSSFTLDAATSSARLRILKETKRIWSSIYISSFFFNLIDGVDITEIVQIKHPISQSNSTHQIRTEKLLDRMKDKQSHLHNSFIWAASMPPSSNSVFLKKIYLIIMGHVKLLTEAIMYQLVYCWKLLI